MKEQLEHTLSYLHTQLHDVKIILNDLDIDTKHIDKAIEAVEDVEGQVSITNKLN